MSSNTKKTATEEGTFTDEAMKAQIESGLAVLRQIAGGVTKVDELIIDREDGGKQILKPKPMSLKEAAMHMMREAEAAEQKVEFTRKFKARPSDGAVAFHEVLRMVFGINAIGQTIPPTMFTPEIKPEYKSVQIDAVRQGNHVKDIYVDVPWGLMGFAPLEAEFQLGYDLDPDYGFCFQVYYVAPKKFQAEVKALFDTVEEYLSKNSIYRGKVLEGVGFAERRGPIVDPKIIDPYNTDRDKIVYTEKVGRALENSVFGVLRNSDALRENGIPLGEKTLLEGPNGSGKTEAAMAAMQIAKEHGWTAIKARHDEDIAKIIAFATRVGGPSLVVIEDIEKLMSGAAGSPQRMDQLLDLFDGAGAKGREVMLVMTSNHAHELSRSMSRPGRIDRIVKVADLDREAFERLVKVLVDEDRLGKDIDYDRMFQAFPECTPVWIVQAIRRAERSVIIRTGKKGAEFQTEDFLYEAEDLYEQLALHRTAADRKETPELETAFTTLVEKSVQEATDVQKRQVQGLIDNWGIAYKSKEETAKEAATVK